MFVELLEERLVELDYRLVDERDGRFDFRTADAVIAFHKVNRMARTAHASTPRRGVRSRTRCVFRPEHDWRGLHLEVDQTRQVAMVVEDGEVTAIFHVSTGKPSTPTRDGALPGEPQARRLQPEPPLLPELLRREPSVPRLARGADLRREPRLRPLPYWNALWVFGLADIGTRVAVYH